MNHQLQTLKFVVVAIAALGFAYLTSVMTKPTPLVGFGLVGESFFPELDPTKVLGLRVVTTSEDTASSRVFKVALKDGAFRIESRNDYPADGKDQLAKTANALLGVKREALVSRVAADHEKYGVVDPLDEKVDSTEGRGHRITLYKEDDVALADIIIGKAVPDQAKQRYARLVGESETETFIVTIDFEVSTKFSDWVEDDLLKLDRDDLVKLESQITTPDPRTQTAATTVVARLDRKASSDPWEMADVKADEEEVNADRLGELVTALDNLKLIGVRERPELNGKRLLNSDLTVPAEFRGQMGLISQLIQSDLVRRGFQIFPTEKELLFLAEAGELVVGAKTGVEYHLSFGNVFTGTEEEMELGGADADPKDATKPAAEKKDQAPAGPPNADDKNGVEGEDEKGPGTKTTQLRGRYVFARATFNADLLGPAPVEPQLPVPPEGVKVDKDGNVIEEAAPNPGPAAGPSTPKTPEPEKAPEGKAAADKEANCDEAKPEKADPPKTEAPAEKPTEQPAAAKPTDEPKTEKPAEPKTGDEPKVEAPKTADPRPNDPAAKTPVEPKVGDEKKPDESPLPTAEPKLDPVTEYKAALAAYRRAKLEYDRAVSDYASNVKRGNEKVEELNKRFADWYYVISADDFDKLSLTRAQIVKAKVKAGAEGTENGINPLDLGPIISPKTPGGTDPAKSPEPTDPPKATDPPKTTDAPSTTDPPKDDAKTAPAAKTDDSPDAAKPDAPPKPNHE